MAKTNAPLLSFNRGCVSHLALARVDLERLRLAASEQTNWAPRMLGPMSIRPGLKKIANTRSDLPAQLIPFVRGRSDTAYLGLTNLAARIFVDDAPISRASVSTTITNGDFSSAVGWTTGGSGGTATIGSGVLTLISSATGSNATCVRSVSVSAPDSTVEHGIRVKVLRGNPNLLVGTTSGGRELFFGNLGPGDHSIAVTPGATTIYVMLENREFWPAVVDSIQIDAAGDVTLDTVWTTADLDYIRWEQSADVIFCCDGAHQQQKIVRRGTRSWSVEKYESPAGPFETDQDVAGLTIAASAVEGVITLTASAALWQSTHVGMLVKLQQPYQYVTQNLAALNATSDVVRVEGIGSARDIVGTISGTFTATIEWQRSFIGPDTGFSVWGSGSYTAPYSSGTQNDGLDNQTVWYRWKIVSYTSGTAAVTLYTASGTASGVARIASVTNSTVATADVVDRLVYTSATYDWWLGKWGDTTTKGWPSAVAMHDGRLWWAGKGREWASTSDDFTNFDEDQDGDSAPIDRTIAAGPTDYINWLISLGRLVVGTVDTEVSVRSSSQDEPLTPTNFNQRPISTQGSAPVPACKIDGRAVFVQAARSRLFEIVFDGNSSDYRSRDLTKLRPDLTDPGVSLVRMAVARQPDTRIYVVRTDGTVAVLLYEPDEEVVCWTDLETDGDIENVLVMPADDESRVYFVVKRVINGSTVRFIEKMALSSDCRGFPDSHLADCHLIYDGVSTSTISGLSHLEGESVVAWGYSDDDSTGQALGTYTVTGGAITLSQAVTNACVGLPYTAPFRSAKLAYGAQLGTALGQPKIINSLALVIADTHQQALEFGQDFTTMDRLPKVIAGATVDDDTMWDELEQPSITIPGQWSPDSRLCLRASAPYPCTVLGVVPSVNLHERN